MRRAGETALAADLHALDTLVPPCISAQRMKPTLDYLALAEAERERLALRVRVKDRAVLQLANVAHAHAVARLGHGARSNLLILD